MVSMYHVFLLIKCSLQVVAGEAVGSRPASLSPDVFSPRWVVFLVVFGFINIASQNRHPFDAAGLWGFYGHCLRLKKYLVRATPLSNASTVNSINMFQQPLDSIIFWACPKMLILDYTSTQHALFSYIFTPLQQY